MKHVDEGTLLALLDGELNDGERSRVEGHVEACEVCTAQLAELRAASADLNAALALLDVPAPAAASAWAVRRRASARRVVFTRRALLRAAAMVLGFAAVGSAAIPESPVREWAVAAWRNSVAALTRSGAEPVAAAVEESAPEAAPASDTAPAEAGLMVQPEDGRVVVSVESPASGLVARVRLASGSRVAVMARGEAAAARFRTAPGRIDVVTPGAGELVIDVPASLVEMTLEVDGRAVVAMTGGELTVSGGTINAARNEVVVELNGSGPVN